MEVQADRDEGIHFHQDESGMEDSLDQTGFLLQRLRELQAWQQEQEIKLLQEQEQQLGQLCEGSHHYNTNDIGSCSEDDDTTIGQDLSSLTSLEEYPREVVPSAECESDTPRSDVGAELESQSLPSWASREDISYQAKVGKSPEDRPILPTKKNFDELLAERLGTEARMEPTRESRRENDSSPTKKSFLRKGSGLARFGGVGAPPKRMKRSRSQVLPSGKSMEGSKFGGSCPKMNIADRETIAYASKKTTPKQGGKTLAGKTPIQPTARPASILKLVSSNSNSNSPGILRKKEPVVTPTTVVAPAVITNRQPIKTLQKQSSGDHGLYDSVELSFMEKLAKAENSHKKDLEDLKTFEMLEEAACDSSFCSSSSDVKRLIQNVHHMPSPIPKPSISIESLTSTPLTKRSPDPVSTFNGFLRNDIQAFLDQKQTSHKPTSSSSSDEDEDTIGSHNNSVPEKPSFLNGSDDEDNNDGSFNNLVYTGGDTAMQIEQKKSKNRVHFDDGEQINFSPPRIPKDSASYLIWSIFAKEKENQKKNSANKVGTRSGAKSGPQMSNGDDTFSPLSKAPLTTYPKAEFEFHTTLLNAKLAELEKEVTHFKTENEKLVQGKRKLQLDRRQLAENVKSFESMKESEKKKLDDERKWVRREKALFEKTLKDKKSNFDKRAQDEIDELQNKIVQLTEELQRKETKWTASITKLQDQVKFLERENQNLHKENHKLKLKGISAKVSTHLLDPVNTAKKLSSPEQQNGTPDSGFRSQDNLNEDCEPNRQVTCNNSSVSKSNKSLPTSLRNTIYQTLCDNSDSDTCNTEKQNNETSISTPRMNFSSADSLDSNVTLVSASTNPVTLTTADDRRATESNSQNLKQSFQTKNTAVVKSVKRDDAKGTTEKLYSDGSIEICYTNGNRKEITPDGKTKKVYYYNGDVKETLPSGLVKYFYSQTKTWHLTYPDGKEVLQFSNGQEEIRYPNGTLQISFSDGSIKRIETDGSEEIKFPDGTHVTVAPNGDRTLLMPNGQKEIHTSNFKRREYPDGTVKILYEDGRQETRYASGRIRIKDREGKLIQDSQANDK